MFSTFSVDDPMPVWLSMSVLGRVIARCVTRYVLKISRIYACALLIIFFVFACSEACFMLSGTVCGGTSVLARSRSAFLLYFKWVG